MKKTTLRICNLGGDNTLKAILSWTHTHTHTHIYIYIQFGTKSLIVIVVV